MGLVASLGSWALEILSESPTSTISEAEFEKLPSNVFTNCWDPPARFVLEVPGVDRPLLKIHLAMVNNTVSIQDSRENSPVGRSPVAGGKQHLPCSGHVFWGMKDDCAMVAVTSTYANVWHL
eukprot:s445_g8.t1